VSRVYVIADLHFGHEKVAQMRGFASAAEHDAALVEAWNRVVLKRDVVYVLGDVFRTERVPELRGVKKLAPGNHDTRSMSHYVELFSKIQSYFEFDGCLLSHIPVNPSQFARWELNVHGHTHARSLPDPRFLSVSVEQCPNLEPVLLGRVIAQRRAECLKSGVALCRRGPA